MRNGILIVGFLVKSPQRHYSRVRTMNTKLGLLVFLTIAAAILLLMNSCTSPFPVLRLTPISPDVEWQLGKGVVTRNDGGIEARLAFSHIDRGDLGFNLVCHAL